MISTDNASLIGTFSVTFTDIPPFNSDLADDFVVPAGQTWNVQSIDADGVYLGPGPANSFNVFFYADNGGLPGTQVYSAVNQPFSVVGSTFTVALPSMAVLTEGTYWVEIQANMTFLPERRVGLEGSHCAVESGRSLAKPRRRLWCVPDVDPERQPASPLQAGQIRYSGLTARQEEVLQLRRLRLARRQRQQRRAVLQQVLA